MQYSYNDGELYYFMDLETYEQIPISASTLSDSFELVVTQTDPGFKGDTATNATKPAILETGAEVKVPLFINEGEKIQIDTRTGEYMSRA